MTTETTKLIDLYNEGIRVFADMYKSNQCPWMDHKTDSLDTDYFLMNSGSKNISLLLERLSNGSTDSEAVHKAVVIAVVKFSDKWQRVYNSMFSDYNPIENYSMTEKISVSQDSTAKTNQNTDMTTEGNNEDNTFGFNSTAPVPSANGSNVTKTTGNKDNNFTESVTGGTSETAHTRSGNIGVTTSQQMIESEIMLRKKHDFYQIVFDDLDSLLAFPIYMD